LIDLLLLCFGLVYFLQFPKCEGRNMRGRGAGQGLRVALLINGTVKGSARERESGTERSEKPERERANENAEKRSCGNAMRCARQQGPRDSEPKMR